ncbi:hypothetical protein [Vibrio quintilis]|nr:hypothetical protein [Vibrio quintilis]
MNKEFIESRIDELKSNRDVGPEGLSIKQIRDRQIKQRFTADEADFISILANSVGVQRAVLSNALFIDAVINMLAEDPELCDEVMAKWSRNGGQKIDFFDEIYARSEAGQPIDGECCSVQFPQSLRISVRSGS